MLNVFKKLYQSKNDESVDWNLLLQFTNYKWNEYKGVQTFGVQPTADIIVHLTKIEKGHKLELHKHPFIFEKMIVVKGKALFNQTRILEVGNYEKIPSDYSHEIEALEDLELITTFYKKYNKN